MPNVLITSELEQGSELHWEHTLAHESELIGVQFRGLTLNRYVVKILWLFFSFSTLNSARVRDLGWYMF